jgi:hypothetical protein
MPTQIARMRERRSGRERSLRYGSAPEIAKTPEGSVAAAFDDADAA